jgi:hypothetical protein
VPGEDPGSSDQPADEPATTEAAPAPTETQPPQEGSGGTKAPAEPDTSEDRPGNDLPPPTDSPAERYEQWCDDNPGACGN